MEQSVKILVWFTMQALPSQKRQFVRILAGSRHSHSTGPVVVQMCQFVRQSLKMIHRQVSGIIHNIVAGGCNCALAYALTHNEEVVSKNIHMYIQDGTN